ncbi:MAG: hypothetical protein EOM26_04765 [Alphaproteobacteria bacterium]|nr:hypothetical protein [Alphaproteobacteria bacterium]
MRTERDKMLAGEPYDPLDKELMAGRIRVRELCQAPQYPTQWDKAVR